MNATIRPADPDSDYPRIAELLNAAQTEVITADTIHEWDQQAGTGGLRRRAVVVGADGQIVGYSMVVHDTWMQPGLFIVWVTIDAAVRRQGLGARAYDEALDFAQQSGAATLTAEVRDDDPASLHFAQRRGFQIQRHIFESTLTFDVAAFDASRFAGMIESVEASGIRIFSLAEAGDTVENRRKLWVVNYQTSLDDPASSGDFPDFDEMMRIFDTSSWFRPAGQILAADGDQFVGLSAVGYFEQSNSCYNLMTGVLASHRGRKIAQALKLRSIQFAKAIGAAYIRTNNDSENAAMLAINRKLGYVPKPGIYRLYNRLKP